MKRIECPWLGCKAKFNPFYDLIDVPARTRWMHHTIMCPKCHNIVGTVEFQVDSWVTMAPKSVKGRHTVHNPKTRKGITVGVKANLNRYLKSWARN